MVATIALLYSSGFVGSALWMLAERIRIERMWNRGRPLTGVEVSWSVWLSVLFGLMWPIMWPIWGAAYAIDAATASSAQDQQQAP